MSNVESDTIGWATDGSRDRGTTLTESRAVLAVVGPVHHVAKLKDTYASIQDAEITAVTLAMMFDMALRNELKTNKAIPSVAYSDHLGTVKKFNAFKLDKDIL